MPNCARVFNLLAQPPAHVRERRDAEIASQFRLGGQSHPLQQRHAKPPSLAEVVDEFPRAIPVPAFVKDHLRVEMEMDERGPRPRDSRHFHPTIRTGVVAGCRALGGGQDSKMSGLMKQVAAPGHASRIGVEDSVDDADAGQERRPGQLSKMHGQADFGEERHDLPRRRVIDGIRIHTAQKPRRLPGAERGTTAVW